MKNLKGVIGYAVGALFAVLTLAWNGMAFYSVKMGGVSDSLSMYKAYSEKDSFDFLKALGLGNLNTGRILSIVTLVIACLVLVACVLGLLNELGIVKVKFINYVNYALAGLFVVFALVSLILVAVDCADYNDMAKGAATMSVGAGMVMVLVSSVVSLAAVLFAGLNFKKKAE